MKNFLLAIACSLALSAQSFAVAPHPDGQSVSKISVIDGSPGGFEIVCYEFVAVVDNVALVPDVIVTGYYLPVTVKVATITPVVAKSYYYSWRQGGFNSCGNNNDTKQNHFIKKDTPITNTKNPYSLVLLKLDKLLFC